MKCACCGIEMVCPKCDGHRCPKCGEPIKQKKNKKHGSTFWGCIDYPACGWTGDKLPPPLPKKLPREMDPLPQDFLDRVQQNHPDLYENWDCECWDDLYRIAVSSQKKSPSPVVQAVAEQAKKQGLLDTLEQSRAV